MGRGSRWQVRGPHAQVAFKPNVNQGLLHSALAKVPGVKASGPAWRVPYNALTVVGTLADTYGIELAYARWSLPPGRPTTWPQVKAELLARGEVEEWVLDGFIKTYQEDAITFGWPRSGVHFWHSTGAGKTLSGIIAALSVDGPVVVVTRAASRLQFGREITRFTKLKPYIVRPQGERRGLMEVNGETWAMFFSRLMPELKKAKLVAQAWRDAKAEHGITIRRGSSLEQYLVKCKEEKQRPVVVVGWEALTGHLHKLKKLLPSAVLFDESHNLKSSKRWEVVHLPELPKNNPKEALRLLSEQEAEASEVGGFIIDDDEGRKLMVPYKSAASSAAELARCPSVKKRLALTATPIKDRVRDLYSPLDFIEPNCWGNTTQWMTRYADRRPGKYGGYDTRGSSNLPELKERLGVAAHILAYSDTHSQLPPKRRQPFYVAPEDQIRPSGGFAKERKSAMARGASALLEVSLAEAASRKKKAVLGLIEDHMASGQKVVVFTGRRRDCENLGKSVQGLHCAKKEGAVVWVAHGGDSDKKRDRVVQEFMGHKGACCLVGTGHAFGEALNMDEADAVLFVMLPYTPGQLRQWEGRFHRASTVRPVLIYYVIAEGTVDEHMASILIEKLPAVEDVAGDSELAEAKHALSGIDEDESDEEFAASVLADLDFG